jgi:predicted nucleotidyltransferase
VDLANPFRSVAPSVEADVLAVLSRTEAALTGAGVQRMAGRSYAQVTGVLRRLVEHGLVDVEQHGRTYSYRLNREHVLAPAVEALVAAGDDVEARLRAALEEWRPQPQAVVLFGSFARRDGDAGSDIDLCLVRPDDVAEDTPAWAAQRYDLARRLERWTGNAAQMVELSVGELDTAVRRNDPLVVSLRREGRTIIGPSVRSLLTSSGAKANR